MVPRPARPSAATTSSGAGVEADGAAAEAAERKAQPGGIREGRKHVPVDIEGDPAGVQALMPGGVFQDLERPDRAALDPSSAVHDRLERDVQRPAPGGDVLPEFFGLEVGLPHGREHT